MSNPQPSSPNFSVPEQQPTPRQKTEVSEGETSDAHIEKPEAAGSPERKVQSNDAGDQNQGQPVNLPAVDLSQVLATTQSNDDTFDPSPLIADDVDVIEKEWVDKAKAVIQAYRSDPHLQEREINKLQNKYLQKRYGKNISKVEE